MDIGTPELIIILIVVLLIFGPGRIVKVSRELGQVFVNLSKGWKLLLKLRKPMRISRQALE